MDINRAADAVDRFLEGYSGRGGRKAVERQVRPSGDDMNHIKVWVNLGTAAENDDLDAWCREAEAAVKKALGSELDGWTLELRADAI